MVHFHLVVLVYPLREFLVVINHNRISAACIVVVWFNQHPLEWLANTAGPFYQLGVTPNKLILLWVYIGHLHAIGEVHISHLHVRELTEVLLGKIETVFSWELLHQLVRFFTLT